MSRNTPKQTPFDDLVPRPGTPSSSSAPPTSPPANNTLPLAGRANAPATRVVAALQDDEPDDDTQSTAQNIPQSTPRAFTPRRRIRRMLPTGTLVGLAMVGGAFIVLALSAVFMRVVPRAQTKSMPPPISTGPRIAESPAQDSDVMTADEEAEAARRAQAGNEASRAPADSGSAGTVVIEEGNSHAGSSADDTSTQSDTRDEDDTPRAGNSRRDESSPDDTRRSDRSNSSSDGNSDGDRFEHGRTGYKIKPPTGFSLQKTGNRTVWRGPRGSQLLVETSNSPGPSPRDDWEKLDKALAKKYGSRYRSLGIRDTTLAGRPAAVWEFEIGDTRKVDIAVHHRGTGYAVLAEANVNDFEEMRPQLESAIRSFQLPARSTRRRTRSTLGRRSTPGTKSSRESDSGNNARDDSGSGY